MEYQDILFEKKGRVAWITLNRPKVMNALRTQTFIELVDCFEQIIIDGGYRVIVLTGAGGNFSSGGDVSWEKEFESGGMITRDQRTMYMKCGLLAWLMRNCGIPIIAMVRGYCIAAGNEINMLCDFTIASEKSYFGQAGTKIGSSPVWWSTQMLPRTIGEKKAREVCMLSRRYTAQEAERMGWVNKVVPDDQLEAEVEKWCEEIMKLSPTALRITKLNINFESDLLQPSLTHGAAILSFVQGTPEFREGVSAFLEKRKPDWEKFMPKD
ncbi:MAG: enoyl-CoA hydratase-related protein [Candidatus Anstonellales archaeon]